MSIHKSSSAQIIRPAGQDRIAIVEYLNPGLELVKVLKNFFLELGFSSIYPNFGNINITTVHPFALLLFQDVMGKDLDLSLFPSVTVSDTSDSEPEQLLSRDSEELILDEQMFSLMEGHIQTGRLICSDTNVIRIKQALSNGGRLVCEKRSYLAHHSLDFLIWSENKEIKDLLYDLVKHCLISNLVDLHKQGIDFQEPITGRREGDFNVDFGSLLYGAQVSATARVETASTLLDIVETTIIDEVIPQGEYQIEGV